MWVVSGSLSTGLVYGGVFEIALSGILYLSLTYRGENRAIPSNNILFGLVAPNISGPNFNISVVSQKSLVRGLFLLIGGVLHPLFAVFAFFTIKKGGVRIMPSEEGRIEIFVADLKDPNDKYRIEQILNNELYKVLEEKVHMSAKGIFKCI
jgi:hypothetical protein